MGTDPLRLAVGTFTRFPVPAPTRVDSRVAGRAIATGPVVGVALGVVTGLPLLLADTNSGGRLLLAAVAVGLCALLTRAIHWDGLADTVDALASGKPADEALVIARRSDLGPMGALALIFVSLLQVAGLSAIDSPITAYATWILACFVGRLGVLIACTRGIPAARTDGLGAAVAQSVPRWVAVLAIATTIVLMLVGLSMGLWWLAGAGLALLATWWVLRVAIARLSGVTGDVLGSVVEIATAIVVVWSGIVAITIGVG